MASKLREGRREGWPRWVLPALLLAAIVLAVGYHFGGRSFRDARLSPEGENAVTSVRLGPARSAALDPNAAKPLIKQ
jgi:hypothetical protein